jgi:uncharacterized protein (UPF0333 family)
MNKKAVSMVLVAVIVIVVVVVVGVAAYWALSNTGGDGGGDGNGGGEDVYTVGNATSLAFTISAEEGNSIGTTVYKAKNIGTDNFMLRIEINAEGMDLIYIVNGAEQKAWADEGSGWQDLSDTFQAQWDAYTGIFPDWTTGGTFTDGDGYTVTVSDVQINPTLEDSLFVVGTSDH